jgi:ABC-type phosphate transport system substrate-binding protein
MKKIIILLLLFACTPLVSAEIMIIGNLNNTVNELTKKQVQAIFMGRKRMLSNGVRAIPMDSSDLRNEFYEKLTHRSIEQINAYWARLMFGGRASPPLLKPDQQSVIEAVKTSKGMIAYIDSELIDETQVKLLFILK